MLWMLFALVTQSGNSSTLGTTLHFTQIFLSKLTTFAWLSLVIFDDTHVYFRFSIISYRHINEYVPKCNEASKISAVRLRD